MGRRGLGPREQGEQHTQRASFVGIRIMREDTQSSSSRAGLGCFVEKTPREAPRHVSSRPDYSLSVGLDARVQGRAKRARRGAERSSSRRWLKFSEPKNLTAESHGQKKMTRA